jgi:hypothetical protein
MTSAALTGSFTVPLFGVLMCTAPAATRPTVQFGSGFPRTYRHRGDPAGTSHPPLADRGHHRQLHRHNGHPVGTRVVVATQDLLLLEAAADVSSFWLARSLRCRKGELRSGTTAYAWTHQPAALEVRTLATLADSPFRKLRMCVFPKSYVFNTNEPARYPFARDGEQDWEAGVVRKNDHVGHLTSIHNCLGFYDHARPWITHCSVQRIDAYRTSENTDEWREAYAKPVVVDECGYEGDLDQGWGNISGRELVRRCWEGAVRGGYVGHGETYLNDREELWWWLVDIIDTWNMTTVRQPGVFTGTFRIGLPGREFMAVRLIAVRDG